MSPEPKEKHAFLKKALPSMARRRKQSKLKFSQGTTSPGSQSRVGRFLTSAAFGHDNGYYSSSTTSSHSTKKAGSKLMRRKTAERRARRSSDNSTGPFPTNAGRADETPPRVKADPDFVENTYETLTMDSVDLTNAGDMNSSHAHANEATNVDENGSGQDSDEYSASAGIKAKNTIDDAVRRLPAESIDDDAAEISSQKSTREAEMALIHRIESKTKLTHLDEAISLKDRNPPQVTATSSALATATSIAESETSSVQQIQQALSGSSNDASLVLDLFTLIKKQRQNEDNEVSSQIQSLQRQHQSEVRNLREKHRYQIQSLKLEHGSNIAVIQQEHKNQIEEYEAKNTQLSNQATSLFRQIASLQNNLEKARGAYEEEKRRHARHFRQWQSWRETIGKVLLASEGAGSMESQGIRFDPGLDLFGGDDGVDCTNVEGAGGNNDDVEQRSDLGTSSCNEDDENGVDDNDKEFDSPRSQTVQQQKIVELERSQKGPSQTQDSDATTDSKSDELRSQSLIGPPHSHEPRKPSEFSSPGVGRTNIGTRSGTQTQSPVLLRRPPSQLPSDREIHTDHGSNAISTPTSNSNVNEYRSSRKNDDLQMVLSPKKLDYTSALPVKEESYESPSQQIDEFSVQIEDDSSDDNDDDCGNGTIASQLDGDDKNISPLNRSSKPHVTPATDDAKTLNLYKEDIPIRDVSNQNPRSSFLDLNWKKGKRPSPSSELDEDNGAGAEGGVKKKKYGERIVKKDSNMGGRQKRDSNITVHNSFNSPRLKRAPEATAAHSTAKGYKYKETVRGKEAREKLHAYKCSCCSGLYDAVLAGEGAKHFDRESLMQLSRHRARFSPDNTPENFWEMSFADSIAKRREEQEQKDHENILICESCRSTGLSQVPSQVPVQECEEDRYKLSQSQWKDEKLSQESHGVAGVEQSIAY